ncbi:MAG: Parallel beta-helix repeat protein [Firmicutes bacterium]|nr:Parallel beta-helix repeat protein [Bacillota bacterium]
MITRAGRTIRLVLIMCLITEFLFCMGMRPGNASQNITDLRSLWEENTGNGVQDDTAIFQRGLKLAAGGTLYIPKASAAYSVSNLQIPANIHIIFEEGTVVQANAGLPINKPLFKISRVANVVIDGNGATFGMLNSQYPSGFAGGTFSITNSADITLNNIVVTSSGGGDGFYINNVDNVVVSGCSASDCVRNGLTLIGANGALIENCVFSQNSDGIHVEPNGPADLLNGIVFQNSFAENNKSYGVSISLDKYKTAAARIDVDISFNNITTRNNGSTGLYLAVYNFGCGIGGAVNVNNYTSDGDKLAINLSNSGLLSPSVVINKWQIVNPTAYNMNKVNYLDAAWVRDLSGVISGKVVFSQF